MNKINWFISKFKKLWADERGRSLVILGLYIIFAFFAVSVAKTSYRQSLDNNKIKEENKELTINEVLEKYKSYSNYSAILKLDDHEFTYTNVEKELIKIDNTSYFIIDNKLVNTLDSSLDVPKYQFDFWYLKPDFIYNLIKNGEESYTKTYNNGGKEYSYIIPLEEFVKSYNGEVIAIENADILKDKNIEVIIKISNNSITNVSIDISTYYKLINYQGLASVIEIEYKGVN